MMGKAIRKAGREIKNGTTVLQGGWPLFYIGWGVLMKHFDFKDLMAFLECSLALLTFVFTFIR